PPEGIALEPGAPVLPPHALYGELFTRVQEEQVFADGKDFCDAIPKGSPAEILARYRAATPPTSEELKRFVATHFTAPTTVGSGPASTGATTVPPLAAPPGASLIDHIDALWGVVTRQPVAAAVLLRDGGTPRARTPRARLCPLSPAARARICLLDGRGIVRGARVGPAASRRPRRSDAGARAGARAGAQPLLGRRGPAAGRVIPRGRGARQPQRARPAGALPRRARRGRERLGLQLTLVRRRTLPDLDRHHRHRAGRSQQPAVRSRAGDRIRLWRGP